MLVWLRRNPRAILLAAPSLVLISVVLDRVLTRAAGYPFTPFSVFQAAAWAIFVHVPLLFGFCAHWIPRYRTILLVTVAIIVAVGIDAFFIEPHALETTVIEMQSPKLVPTSTSAGRIRIGLLADIQTSRVGLYEEKVIDAVIAADPDLVLFAGDYIQARWPRDLRAFGDNHRREVKRLNELLRRLHPPMGMIAVRGDVDYGDWPMIFEGLPVVAVTTSRTLDLGPIVVTALAPDDSRSESPPVPVEEKFHVVLGHAPDFALASPPGDLLLAGHTHGGQVRIPFFGPLLTMSRVPRAWASGVTRLPGGGTLLVSRGIGLERADAPPLRFLCRPELVIIDLVPAP